MIKEFLDQKAAYFSITFLHTLHKNKDLKSFKTKKYGLKVLKQKILINKLTNIKQGPLKGSKRLLQLLKSSHILQMH